MFKEREEKKIISTANGNVNGCEWEWMGKFHSLEEIREKLRERGREEAMESG